jgi:TetR/AcrR family transcriptional repressor of nem operon
MQKVMRYPAEETAAKHDRIVEEASRLFRERGFEDVTVGEIMKAAGLTHGAFYAHFDSKEALQAAAVAHGQGVSLDRAKRASLSKSGQRLYLNRYLSLDHRDNPGNGCTMAALAQDISRSTPEVKKAMGDGFESILSAMSGSREDAIFQSAARVGAIVLARAVQDEALSDEILGSIRKKLS